MSLICKDAAASITPLCSPEYKQQICRFPTALGGLGALPLQGKALSTLNKGRVSSFLHTTKDPRACLSTPTWNFCPAFLPFQENACLIAGMVTHQVLRYKCEALHPLNKMLLTLALYVYMTLAAFNSQAALAVVMFHLLQLAYLGDNRQRCTMIQKHRSYIFMPFPSRKVQGCVA